MTPEGFRLLLDGAMSGGKEDIEKLLSLYKMLIDKHSRINGVIDEDLRQHLVLHILLHLREFPIR